MEDKQFDKYIEQKLRHHSTDVPGDWDHMADLLREEGVLDRDADLDHIIQSKLAGFVDTEHTSDWNSFRQELSTVEDTNFDSTLKANMQDLKADYQESHWAILHQNLLAESYKRKRVAAIKVAELLLLLLFVSGIFTALPTASTLYEVPAYRPIAQQMDKLVVQGMSSVRSLWTDTEVERSLIAVSIVDQYTTPTHPNQWPYIATALESTTTPATIPSSITAAGQTAVPQSIAILTPSVSYRRHLHPLSEPTAEEPLDHTDRSQQVLTLGGGLSHNFVEVPDIGNIGSEPSQYMDTDYTISATYGVRKGRLEVFTGLSFYRVSYSPDTSLGLVNNAAGQQIPLSEIDKVNYAFLSIPLGIRVHALTAGDWQLYGTAGINMDFKATTSYDLRALTTAELKLAENNPAAFGGDVFLREEFANDEQKGLLQGGTLGDNLSLTAFAGVGISRKFTDDISLYLQPTYHKNFSLDGSGAQDERINNLRLEIGVRTLF